MSYLVLARKFRPQTFSDVSGQEHVTRTLANSIKRNRIAHAYLFAGPRGVGKTSIARIMSKALNCAEGPTAQPCMKCTNCAEIAQGTSLAVREIDGASHNSVENVRELIDSFRALPAPGSKYKVYIIDEVHMLSTSAFNALLKSLEEPPPHTIFILATTEAHKIPETVISRCQRHDFRALSQDDISERLKQIAEQEKIALESEALRMIVRLSDGSMRDAQSLLERVRVFCDDQVTAAETGKVLGTVERSILAELSTAIFARDTAGALSVADRVFSTGIDIGLFLKDFVAHFRDLLMAGFGGPKALEQMGLVREEAEALLQQVKDVPKPDLEDLVELARSGADIALRSNWPRYALEALIVRMTTREPVEQLGRLIAGLEGRASAAGAQTVSSAQPATRPAPGARAGGISSPARSETPAQRPAEAPGPAPLKEYDWADFVTRIGQSGGSPVLAEQLKRVAITKFSAGLIEGGGPEFSVSYLQKPENRKKLETQLMALYGVEKWNIRLSNEGGAPGAASLQQKENQERERQISEKKESITNHPKLKSLQKAFPGSKIEKIDIKEK